MRGILMIEPLYHQTIAGNKTQTRRSGGLEMVNKYMDEFDPPVWVEEKIGKNIVSLVEFMRPGDRSTVFQAAPRYKVGEVLYIKEPYITQMAGSQPAYAEDTGDWVYETMYAYDKQPHIRKLLKWKNKLFMPASAARAFIRITGIRCERLLPISIADCIAEGIEQVASHGAPTLPTYRKYGAKKGDHRFSERLTVFPRESFISLYKFANKVKEVPNIWVWVYTFEYLPNYKI